MPVLDKLLDKGKVIKLEICTFKGRVLLTVSKNYTFPQKIVNENERFSPNESVFIKGRNLPVFARNASIVVIAHTRAGERFSFPGHIAVSTESQLNISINQVEAELLPDRRRFYKVAQEIPCVITSITRSERHVAIDPPLPAIISDINIGGIFIKGSKRVELKKEDTLAVIMTNAGGAETELVAKILRVATSPEGEITGYGCQFLFLNSGQEEAMGRLINKLQIEQRALERAETAL
jgi:c-di-GMP-binding flagellar brake protein YcgR